MLASEKEMSPVVTVLEITMDERDPNATTRHASAMIPGSTHPRCWLPWFVDASGLITRNWFVPVSRVTG